MTEKHIRAPSRKAGSKAGPAGCRNRLGMWHGLAFVLAILNFVPSPAQAQLEAVLETQVEQAGEEARPQGTDPGQVISDTKEAGSDTRIASRIRGIYAQLPDYKDVEVTVRQGVVVLTGTVPESQDASRAEEIAARVSGVVTVESDLSREISISYGADEFVSLKLRFQQFVRFLPLVGLALAVAFGIGFLGYAIAGLTGVWRRIAPNSFLAELIASAVRFVFVVAGLIAALNMVGADTLLGAVLGGAGLIGLALGFALRDTIENYVASLMLSVRQPFLPNDHVVIDSYEGRVIRLTSRATILMTLDGNHLRVPNSQVFKAVILNYTRNPQRRFEFDLGIDADDDALAARRLGRDTLSGLPFVLDEPGPEARVLEVGDSNVVIRFLGWIDQEQSDWFKAQSLSIVAVKAALEKAGFGLPEPIYRLRFDPRSLPELPANPGPQTPPSREVTQPAHAAGEIEDVRPTDEIRDMVEAERASAGGVEVDLLDAGRPTE